MKKKLLKLFALLFSGSLVVLFILYQTGSFDPVKVYNLSYPSKSNNNADSTFNKQRTEKSQSSKNQTIPAVPTNIELPKEQNVVIQFDGKIRDTKEQERIRMMSSKSLIFPREKTELDKYFDFVNAYDSIKLSEISSNRLFLLDTEVQELLREQQWMPSSKFSTIKFKPIKK